MAYTPFDLGSKTVLVTGGNGGIGLGMAQACAQAGADIAIWGTNDGKNAKAVEALTGEGAKAKAYQVDVSDEEAVRKGVTDVISDFGRIDSVFANAGVGFGAQPFIDMPTDVYRKVLSVNLDGVFFTLRETAKHMVDRAKSGDPGGRMVVVSSLSAIEGAARNEHYAATKGAVISMIKGCAVEFARYGVTANAILPGWIATDMTETAQNAQVFTDKVISRVPARRWGEPEDFGGVAVYLASDASKFHSGDTFVIDGGYAIF